MANLIRKRKGPTSTVRREWEDPFSPRLLQREIDQLFDDFFNISPLTAGGGEVTEFSPQMDVMDRDNELVVCTDLPGLSEKDIHVEVSDDNMLTIRGEKARQESKDDRGYRVSERSYGSFARMVQLPGNTDSSKIEAEFKDGVLEIHIPKSAEPRGHEVLIGKGKTEKEEKSEKKEALSEVPLGQAQAPSTNGGQKQVEQR
jgi:HSP20 family protein